MLSNSTLASLREICHFFFNDTATTEIYTLSLHDALPIFILKLPPVVALACIRTAFGFVLTADELLNPNAVRMQRSEEHTSELQSRRDLVCRLLLEKKKNRLNRRLP